MDVVIVESPAKAKTINKYLGGNYTVLASYGHVRDLPPKDGSVEPDADFQMHWEVQAEKSKQVKAIVDAIKGADRLVLATDPDREGEAISWHLMEVLRARKALPKGGVQRVTFNEITKSAVTKAMAAPRDLHADLIDAYLARRALDYLVGFTLSPVLWRKLPGAKSAGRVQSVALRLICERETEIERFHAREYWTIGASMRDEKGQVFDARLVQWRGAKLGQYDLPDEATAMAAKADVAAGRYTIASVEKKPVQRHPAPPFTTSTLQQEAARKLGFTASQTMRIAQQLYEGVTLDGETTGLITYMRTDGVQISGEAIAAARRLIEREHGPDYVPDKPRAYSAKAKNAQEAHEAIRPTDLFRGPDSVRRALSPEQAKLYELIWKRTLASQMASARLERTTADLAAADGKTGLRATGQVVLFPGFLALYQEGVDDSADEEDRRLPPLTEGGKADPQAVEATQHFTTPPPRYSEASLVKKLEELGIGRPSTYASILQTLRDRAYVRMDKNRFLPEDKGRLVTAFLEKFFARYVGYDFTADLENQLDAISAGDLAWKQVLRDFWADFQPKTKEILDQRPSDVVEALDRFLEPLLFPARADGSDPRLCPTCQQGRLSLKTGKFGAFIGCSNYPECKYTRPFGAEDATADAANDGPQLLGTDPATGLPVTLRTGRFGRYVQLGEDPAEKGAPKPPRASLPRDVPAEALSLELALRLLSLPRTIGQHPETGKPITASIGRFGPYIAHDGAYVSLKSTEDALTIGMNQAVVALADKANRPGRAGPSALRDLGANEAGAAIKMMNGRYGAYVTDGTTNATLPKDVSPEAVTLEQALALIADRAAKGGGKKPVKRAAPRKAPAKKPAKAAAAKTPAKAAKPTATKPTAAKTKATKPKTAKAGRAAKAK
ncbi:MAG: type I DNA topoisomerase [Sphingomonadales bacterium]|nr:MAG: type I DNA topoisomerase [Sphingomonadales bacterium]